jgi:TrwC relaxase
VVADIAKLSVGREAYYTRELATDHEAYLSGHGESPGRWYGAGATGLGLEGEASVAGFQAMFEGRDPTTGELLGRPHGRNAVPAFDVVLRPTKSVSILYGLGDPATGRAVLSALWVPKTHPAHATRVYSWIAPPRRSSRRIRWLVGGAGWGRAPSGGAWPRERCGRCSL